MSCIGTNNSDNNCNTTDKMNSKVSSALMNSIEKTPITSNIGLDQIPGIRMITNQTSTTTIDKISCSKNNNILIPKCQSDDTKITCASDNINNVHNVPCANNYDNITLSKYNHQESRIELIPIINQQNVTTSTVNTPTKSTEAHKLLTTKVSSIKELLDNTLKMEQLLASTSTTDTTHLTYTIPGNETLLLVMISSMKQIVKHPPSPSFECCCCCCHHDSSY